VTDNPPGVPEGTPYRVDVVAIKGNPRLKDRKVVVAARKKCKSCRDLYWVWPDRPPVPFCAPCLATNPKLRQEVEKFQKGLDFSDDTA
jgi:hypothetical protein